LQTPIFYDKNFSTKDKLKLMLQIAKEEKPDNTLTFWKA